MAPLAVPGAYGPPCYGDTQAFQMQVLQLQLLGFLQLNDAQYSSQLRRPTVTQVKAEGVNGQIQK